MPCYAHQPADRMLLTVTLVVSRNARMSIARLFVATNGTLAG